MTLARTSLVATAAVGLILALSGCGRSDEEQIRTVLSDVSAAFDKRDPKACGLLTPRATAQFVGFVGAFAKTDDCERLVAKLEPDTDVDVLENIRAGKITIRGNVAILTSKPKKGEADPGIGLRKIDGDWKIDNMLNPSFAERPRGLAQLTKGSDEQQIRATIAAANTALTNRDYKRMCNLLSYGAEAQVLIGAALASIAEPDVEEPDAAMTCASAWRALESLTTETDDKGFASEIPTLAQMRAARVVVRGDRATVTGRGLDATRMLRLNGRWLIDADSQEAPTPAEYERCWRAAGAQIATRASDLAFARGTDARHVAATLSRISVKGKNWRIFYTTPDSNDDPGIHAVLRDPNVAEVVAYVQNASTLPDVVAKARDCGDD